MKKIVMSGMDIQYITLIHESVKICDASKEFIDNAIDAGANKVEISLDNGIYTVKDNAPCGMVNTIEKFAESYKSHISNRRNTIGIKGVGAKDAILRLADFFGQGSLITIVTSNGDVAKKLTWNLCERTKSINDIFIDDIDPSSEEVGTTIMITNPCGLNGQIMGLVKYNISYAYAYKMKFEGLEIFFKGGNNDTLSKLDPIDYFYLDKLCGVNGEYLERLKTQGNYECDGFFFIVRQNTFKKNGSSEQITIPSIQLYIGEGAERAEYDDGRDAFNDAKFGAMFNGRLISSPSTTQKMHFKKSVNTGGSWRCRTIIFVNDNTYDILSGRSNKSKGVASLQSNEILKEYSLLLNGDICDSIKKMYKVEDKKSGKSRYMNAYETLELQYLWLTTINAKRKKGENVTIDDVNASTSKRQVASTTIKEGYNSITENAIFLTLDDKERKMMCLFEKSLKDYKIDDVKKTNILNSMLESYCTA